MLTIKKLQRQRNILRGKGYSEHEIVEYYTKLYASLENKIKEQEAAYMPNAKEIEALRERGFIYFCFLNSMKDVA